AMAAVLLLLSASLASVAAQCGSANMARCSIWINNGFCTNTAYNVLIRQASCPTMCKMGCPNTPSTAREACLGDGNANCAAWSTNAANPFCLSTTMTAASKFIYCCRTCAAEITPQGDCLIYNNARTRVSSLTNNAAIQTIPTGNTLFRAFVRTGCRLRLFAEATAVPATATPLQT
ncbi:hypothetical protein PMAYCL1PPCAC_32577, partial [Pristionchus mayeri]